MSGQPDPPLIVESFGKNAAAGYITFPIPVDSQIGITPGAASFNDGFPPSTMTAPNAGGVPPKGQEFNGILKMITAHLAALNAGQLYAYDADLAIAMSGYQKGAIVVSTSGIGFWINDVDGNSNDPDVIAPASSGWEPLVMAHSTQITDVGGTVSLSAFQAAASQLVLTGVLTSNLIIVVPPWQKTWFVANRCTMNNFTVTIKLAATTGAQLPPGPNWVYVYNGTLYAGNTVSGSFPCTYVGGSGVTGVNTAYYRIVGSLVSIMLPVLSATSNSNAFSYTGIPRFLIPALSPDGNYQLSPVALAKDNSIFQPGCYATAELNAGVPTLFFVLLNSGGGWTTTGTKAVLGTVMYDLLPGA